MKTVAITPYSELYERESAEIRRRFEESPANRAGRIAASARAALVDRIVAGLFQEHVGEVSGFAIIALGGYGRAQLFPYSDIDLLFLSADSSTEAAHKAELSALTQNLWDLHLKLGQTSRTPAECGRLHRDNLEFNVGLLDARFLAGDERLFQQLARDVLPPFLRSNGAELLTNLATMSRKRHARHGNTIFHLEPNLKESPGGLRDYNVAQWISQISAQPPTAQEENAAPSMERAFDFLATARCLLHYRRDRDDNRLTYEIQSEAAGSGAPSGQGEAPEEWMRRYFRHARAIFRHTCAMLDRSLEQTRGRGSLLGMYQDWRSRLSTADFAVVKDRIYIRQPGALEDPALLLGLFEHVARHGLALSGETEVAVERALEDLRPRGEGNAMLFSGLWRRRRPILTLPHAAQALRAMHSLQLLTALFPEFAAVDCLVVRDFYHRYTVDEHTFQTIAGLLALSTAEGQWERLFAEILGELEQPELLSLALLLHDIGKGMADDHVQGSLQAAEGVFARLGLEQADRSAVRFLIRHHLEMSATMQRRDIFDPETARTLAGVAATPERLKMLTLLTYADIQAVNPEALTPWKAEMLWRLYTAASGYLTRSVDDDRIPQEPAQGTFLAGFPRRYQSVHTPEEIAMHAEMARDLPKHPVQVRVAPRSHGWELTVVTADRPRLFSSVTGVLAAWGMSIQKADAFANAAGIVLDVFRFADLYKTLELNPGEADRLRRDVTQVLQGKLDLANLMSGRHRPAAAAPKIKVNTQIRFDQSSSSHSTLLEIVTGDRPGLLYDIATKLAEAGCNIEVALIDTEGHKAIDVFYLTAKGAKLEPETERELREKLVG